MKKAYYQPTTERVVLNLSERITWGEFGNGSNTGTHTGGKENIIIFEEIVEEEEPDTTDIWNSDPWKIQYSLWDED